MEKGIKFSTSKPKIMKYMCIKLWSLILAFTLPFLTNAQVATLKDKLAGKTTLEEVMQIVDQHYADMESGKIKRTNEPGYKHWARWAWYASGRLGENGEFVDVNQKLDAAKRILERERKIYR